MFRNSVTAWCGELTTVMVHADEHARLLYPNTRAQVHMCARSILHTHVRARIIMLLGKDAFIKKV